MKRPAFFVVFLAFILLIGFLTAQTGQKEDKPVFIQRIDSLYRIKQFDVAISLIDSLIPEIRKNGQWQSFAQYESRYAKILKDKGEYEKALLRLQGAIGTLTQNGLGSSEQAAGLWIWVAMNNRMLQRWNDALEAYRNAIRNYEDNHSLYPNLPYAYKNAAQICLRFSDNHQAINYLEAAMRTDTGNDLTTSIRGQLTSAYIAIDSLKRAADIFSQIDLTQKTPYTSSALMIGSELAEAHGALDLAESRLNQALKLLFTEKDQRDNIIRAYSSLAQLAAKRGNNDKAKRWFQEAETFGDTCFRGQKSREMAKLYNETASFYFHLNDLDKALNYSQLALIQVFKNFNEKDWRVNPPLKDVYAEWQLASAATSKAEFLLHGKPELRQRKLAAESYALGLEAAELLRRQSSYDEDKIDLAGNMRNWTKQAIDNLVEIQRVEPTEQYCSQLLRLIERSKSQALRDALEQKNMFDYVDLPDSIRLKEKELRREIASFEQQKVDVLLSGKMGDTTAAKLADIELFRAQAAYQDLLDQVKSRYPAFGYQFLQSPTLSVDSLRATLPDTAAVMSWFDAGDRFLLLLTRKNGISLHEIPCDTAFKNLISDFVRRLSDRIAQEKDPDRYFDQAWRIHQKLIPAAALNGIRSLTIIPDGVLCYLPFEALLTAEYRGNYARAPYLMRDYTVAYNWSAVLPLRPAHKSKGMLQVAPFVSAARDGLAVLPDSRLETPGRVKAVSLLDSAAAAANFVGRAGDFAVLHIASHAQAGGPALPRVEFYDRSMSAREIYGLRLDASLVTLSACETGAGNYASGEGVLSLARAFAAVGARSLVAGYWSVNEASTSEIFKFFYAQLFEGQSKSNSLRAAKLAYLAAETPDARKAPFYWAAFTLTGADDVVDPGGGFSLVFWVCCGALLLAGIGFLLKKLRFGRR